MKAEYFLSQIGIETNYAYIGGQKDITFFIWNPILNCWSQKDFEWNIEGKEFGFTRPEVEKWLLEKAKEYYPEKFKKQPKQMKTEE